MDVPEAHAKRGCLGKESFSLGISALALLLAASCFGAATDSAPAPARAAVFYDHLPGQDQALARDIAAQVAAAGYSPELVYLPVLTNGTSLTAQRYDLLVLPNARMLPLVTAPVIDSYLREGGNLLALGLPAWDAPVFQAGGKWLTRQQYDNTLASQHPTHVVQDFAQADLAKWRRAKGDDTGKAQYELADTASGKALHATIAHLAGWETLTSPALPAPFAANNTLTCFRAKGGPHTRLLAIEWREDDGSRWIGTVELTPQWTNYALPPDRFKAWPPEAVAEHRRFDPTRAVSCTVGISQSHTAPEGDEHEYWFADLGTAPNPFGADSPPEETDIPVLESISPTYQCYPITTEVMVRPDHLKSPLESWDTPPPGAGEREMKGCRRDALAQVGLQPRARGGGFEQGRPYRWEPLLGAYDAHSDDYRGAVAALVVNVEKPYYGSVWAAFTPADAAFYQQPIVTNALRQVLARMKRGLFLAEGGSEFFTTFLGQPFTAGARVVNFGKAGLTNLSLEVAVDEQTGNLPNVVLRTNLTLLPGETEVVASDDVMLNLRSTPVHTSLTQGHALLDVLENPLAVWQPTATPHFITARDGAFRLDGKPWKVHGVNYLPSSGIGLANHQYFENWLGRGAYDPEVIQRDLLRIKGMNFNAVSVFIDYSSLDAQHLLDFLRRCRNLDLHVNLSLRPGSPMNFHWDKMKAIIEHYGLAGNDTVFAYDLAWEPSHGGYAEQQRDYAGLWQQWIIRKYGTVDAATNAWAFPAPRRIATPKTTLSPLSQRFSAISIDIPTAQQLTTDGPWRVMVADYRLCLDEILNSRYSAARELIHSIDPNHAVSFRMSCAGDPLYNWDGALPYDFYGLADAVDIWEPEAYGRVGDWPRVRAGDFTAAYARLCNSSLPLVWAEMGYSVWDMNRMAPDPQKLAWEASYYANFYRMMRESGADGVFFWWYPGGFRLGENSDFGVINPDGTDRPVTKVIRAEGPRFLAALKPPPPSEWIPVNRDHDARGLYGIYQAVQERFWKAIDAGRRPGLSYERE